MRVMERIHSLTGSAGLTSAAGLGLLGLTLGACGPDGDTPLVTISPLEPGTLDTLRLQIAEQSGFDYRVAWTVDGAEVADATDTVDAQLTTRGQTWEVTVTPVETDSGKRLEPTVASVTIGNAAPFGIVTLTPSEPGTGQDLVAQPGFTDPDGDEVSATYAWTRNGTDAGISGNTVTGDRLIKGDVWEVTVVASDGNAETEPVFATATVANTPPTAEGARIQPEQVFDDTEVTCEGLGFADADGDTEQFKTLWKVDGLVVSSEPTLTGEFFDRGQTISCELIPTDGTDDGSTLFANDVVVQNGVPTMDSVTIDEANPNRNAALTFTANNLTDADGDEVTLDIWWLVNGRGVSKDATLDPGFFKRGDEITVQVTPDDGFSLGDTQTSPPVTVGNAPPVVVSSEFGADPIYTDTVLTPVNEIVDRDGDPITLAYSWEVNGTAVGDETGTLNGANEEGNGFDKSDTVAYAITANDGIEDGEVFSSAVVTVANKPPEEPLVTLEPELSLTDENIVCTLADEATDADGDSVSLTFLWTVDGAPYTGLTATTVNTGDTIPAAATELGETWECTVELDDGTDVTEAEPVSTVVRPELIYYTAESSSDLGNAGSSCTSGGATGYYSNQYFTGGTQWISKDIYKTSPDTLTIKWRQGFRVNSTSFDYVRLNGSQIYFGSGLPIARSTDCDSGRVYEVTFSGSVITGLWNTGGTNRFEIAHGCCSFANNGVFYDDEVEYGRLRVWTPLDPE